MGNTRSWRRGKGRSNGGKEKKEMTKCNSVRVSYRRCLTDGWTLKGGREEWQMGGEEQLDKKDARRKKE